MNSKTCKTTALCNQKGGVTKTTTTANLGIGLALHGKKILLMDIDPQADLTASLGWRDTDSLQITMLTTQRRQLSSKSRSNKDDEKQTAFRKEVSGLSDYLKKLRREVWLCEDIQERSGVIKEKICHEREERMRIQNDCKEHDKKHGNIKGR